MKITTAQNRWHRFIYRAARPLVSAVSHCLISFRSEKYTPKHQTFLLMSNHYTDFDMLFIYGSIKRQQYFVASEHISHWGWLGRLISFLVRPIWRAKGRTDAQCAMDIMRVLKRGFPVAVFIEGERSWGGRTMPIADSAGRLARMSGAALITYRISNAYMVWPRWSKHKRKGRIRAEVVHEYAPEELAAMTNEQVQALIERDVYCDFYADQQRQPQAFPAKGQAEALETALYLCPHCGEIGGLSSHGDRFSCACGFSLRLDEYGYFAAAEGDAPFRTVQQWFDWQQQQLPDYIARHSGVLAADQRGQSLSRAEPDAALQPLGVGAISLDREGLHFDLAGGAHYDFALNEISALAAISRMLLSFSAGGADYEVRSEHPRSAIKYVHLYRALKAQAAAAGKTASA